jgi:hypothetical protein
VNILKTIFFGAVLSVLHYFATFIFLFEVIFARWDSSERPLATGEIVRATFSNAILRVASFPVLLAGEWFYKAIPPDNVFYLLAVLNSCLWGFSIMLLWNYRAQLFAGLKTLRLRRAIT